jgi:hypothetical protein
LLFGIGSSAKSIEIKYKKRQKLIFQLQQQQQQEAIIIIWLFSRDAIQSSSSNRMPEQKHASVFTQND